MIQMNLMRTYPVSSYHLVKLSSGKPVAFASLDSFFLNLLTAAVDPNDLNDESKSIPTIKINDWLTGSGRWLNQLVSIRSCRRPMRFLSNWK